MAWCGLLGTTMKLPRRRTLSSGPRGPRPPLQVARPSVSVWSHASMVTTVRPLPEAPVSYQLAGPDSDCFPSLEMLCLDKGVRGTGVKSPPHWADQKSMPPCNKDLSVWPFLHRWVFVGGRRKYACLSRTRPEQGGPPAVTTQSRHRSRGALDHAARLRMRTFNIDPSGSVGKTGLCLDSSPGLSGPASAQVGPHLTSAFPEGGRLSVRSAA